MEGSATYCVNCGAPVSGGRFCTSCGAPISRLVATSVREPAYAPPQASAPPGPASAPPPAPPTRASTPPPAPPAAASTPPPAPPAPSSAPAPTPAPEPAPAPAPAPAPSGGGPGPGLWVGAAAVLLVIVLLGAWLLFHDSFGNASGGPTAIVPSTGDTTPPPSSDSAGTSATAPTSPTATQAQVGKAADVAGLAAVSAPTEAPAGVDFAGNRVTYGASNLVDGALDTCWRMAGDATGTVLTFELDQPTTLSRVGLVNGYAKTAFSGGRRFDWYAGNRRVVSVDWIFDDGSSVSQSFSSTREMQTEPIDPVTTSTVRLEITAVSPPGHGRAARDDTAISEVTLVGSPG